MTWQLGLQVSIEGQCVAALPPGGTLENVGTTFPWYQYPDHPTLLLVVQAMNTGDAIAPAVRLFKTSWKGGLVLTQTTTKDLAPGEGLSSGEPFVWNPTPAAPYAGYDLEELTLIDPAGNNRTVEVYLLRDAAQLADLTAQRALTPDAGCGAGPAAAGGGSVIPIALVLGVSAGLVLIGLAHGRRP